MFLVKNKLLHLPILIVTAIPYGFLSNIFSIKRDNHCIEDSEISPTLTLFLQETDNFEKNVKCDL